ncbi:uncharacterized protein L203_100935 [Cryptococcus depauperatus CBS 7841]|uniref:Endonuclease/exonuclease/phosphatase domain-containing protein n=1 Tax=Cryptococcus depauperatus CBS 7841 TaxID=1295531 RepID=A0AAJ8JP07_9TREE
MSSSLSASYDSEHTLKVLSFNVWGLAFISKDRKDRIRAIAEHLASSSYDIVCLQELWVYKDYEIVREEVQSNLPFSRFFHTGALGSGLAIFTRFPLIAAHAFPYSLSGSPAQGFAGDFFVKKAAANVVILHPVMGEVEIWNTHMDFAEERPPDTRQAHRITQSWQLANAIRGGAAKGRYILVMGDFNSQPWSVPIAMMKNHAHLVDSYLSVHPSANDEISSPPTPDEAIKRYGMTCDSPLNSYSSGKRIPEHVLAKGGKRLDYIFYRQPAIARERPLMWRYQKAVKGDQKNRTTFGEPGGHLESGKPLEESVSKAPILKCIDSQVIFTDNVPGRSFSYSDHYALFSTFTIEEPDESTGIRKRTDIPSDQTHPSSSVPLIPTISEAGPEQVNTDMYAARDPFKNQHLRDQSRASMSSSHKLTTIRSALNTIHLYTRLSKQTSKRHLRICAVLIIVLVCLTVGSAWQPKSWLQPIFTIVGGLLGAAAVSFLYTGYIWGRWEEGLLTEVTEEMELELKVTEMVDNIST